MAIDGGCVGRDYGDYKVKQIKENRDVGPELLGGYGIRL